MMGSVWILQDVSDYYGPDFHAVFSSEAAAESYMAAYERMWLLEEVPLHDEPPEVVTVHSIVLYRELTSHPWPTEPRYQTLRKTSIDTDLSVYPQVFIESHLVRVDALSEGEAWRLFGEAMQPAIREAE